MLVFLAHKSETDVLPRFRKVFFMVEIKSEFYKFRWSETKWGGKTHFIPSI